MSNEHRNNTDENTNPVELLPSFLPPDQEIPLGLDMKGHPIYAGQYATIVRRDGGTSFETILTPGQIATAKCVCPITSDPENSNFVIFDEICDRHDFINSLEITEFPLDLKLCITTVSSQRTIDSLDSHSAILPFPITIAHGLTEELHFGQISPVGNLPTVEICDSHGPLGTLWRGEAVYLGKKLQGGVILGSFVIDDNFPIKEDGEITQVHYQLTLVEVQFHPSPIASTLEASRSRDFSAEHHKKQIKESVTSAIAAQARAEGLSVRTARITDAYIVPPRPLTPADLNFHPLNDADIARLQYESALYSIPEVMRLLQQQGENLRQAEAIIIPAIAGLGDQLNYCIYAVWLAQIYPDKQIYFEFNDKLNLLNLDHGIPNLHIISKTSSLPDEIRQKSVWVNMSEIPRITSVATHPHDRPEIPKDANWVGPERDKNVVKAWSNWQLSVTVPKPAPDTRHRIPNEAAQQFATQLARFEQLLGIPVREHIPAAELWLNPLLRPPETRPDAPHFDVTIFYGARSITYEEMGEVGDEEMPSSVKCPSYKQLETVIGQLLESNPNMKIAVVQDHNNPEIAEKLETHFVDKITVLRADSTEGSWGLFNQAYNSSVILHPDTLSGHEIEQMTTLVEAGKATQFEGQPPKTIALFGRKTPFMIEYYRPPHAKLIIGKRYVADIKPEIITQQINSLLKSK